MGRDQGRGDLLCDGELVALAQTIAPSPGEVMSLHQLEHDEVAVSTLDVLVDPADVGVLELRQDLRFAQEPGSGGVTRAPLLADGLHCHPALEALVDTDVDLTHAAFAEPIDDPDVTNHRAHE